MLEDVKACVEARTNFFVEYISVPANMQAEVDSLLQDITNLGESCADSTEFEAKFISNGLSDRFNAILPKCTQKSHKMTKEEKQFSKQVLKDIVVDNKEQIAKDAINDVASHVYTRVESDMIADRRERMIDAGTFDDYTRASNTIGDAMSLGRFLKGKFKK